MTTRPTTRKMTTAAIARRINAGVASTADRHVYVSRVERLRSEPCGRDGHFYCAAFYGGPCITDVVSTLYEDAYNRPDDPSRGLAWEETDE
jgi:hypothetical protein